MFDFNKFLTEKFGHPENVVRLVRAYGMTPPNQEAVTKWFKRNTVPSAWLPILIAVVELEVGGPVRLAFYLRGDNNGGIGE